MLIAGFLCAQTQTWTWSEDELSIAQMGISATVLDNSIFYSGGRIDDYSTFFNVIDIYDVGTGEWDTYESQSSGRWQTMAVSANGMVFFAGGNNYHATNWHSFADIDVYNKDDDEWTIEYLSTPRSHMGSVALGNKVFFAGGVQYESSVYYDIVDIYDTETGFWSTEYLSIPRAFMGSAASGSKVFFAGGSTGPLNQVTNVVDIYDINNDEWTVEYLSVPRAFTAAVAYEGKVYFAGGALPNNTSSVNVDIYNVEEEEWEVIETLSEARIVTALNVKNALIFTGVCNYINLSTGDWVIDNGTVEIYYPETGHWDLSVPPLDPARIFYAYASYDNKAYYAGGWIYWTSQGEINTVNILKYTPCMPDGITFTSQDEIDNFQTNYPYCSQIGGDVEINGNDITDLNGLNFVTAIGGNLSIINCDNLTSLWGLENIKSESIVDLSIYDNSVLSECDIWNICYYLNNTSGIVDIHDNASGCDTEDEISEACLTSVCNIDFQDKITISPNPLNSTTFIQYTLHQNSLVIIKIMDLSGRLVVSLVNEIQQQGEQKIEFNTTGLPAGIYFCVLKTNEGVQMRKIVKL
jgi:hypothetical protein